MCIYVKRVSFVRLNLKFEKKGEIMKSKYTRFAILCFLLASLPFYFGCESDVMVGSLVLTIIGDDKIVANDKDFATIEAKVTGFGDPEPPGGLGAEVDFETTLGYFANGRPAITLPVTGPDGIVITYLWAPKGTGTDQLEEITIDTAVVSGTVEDATRFVKITIIGCEEGNDPAKIELAVDPETIPADGVTSSKITATITDCEGEGVLGTDLEFRTDKGLFSNGKMTIIKTTRNDLGTVDAFLIALEGTPLGPAKIEVRSKEDPRIIALITIKIGARSASIELKAEPDCIAPDGRESSEITAIVTDYQGAAVPPGTSVKFETIVGRFSNGSTSITVTTTGTTGTAVAHFIAPVGTEPQLAQITAMSMGVSARAVVEVSDSC